MIRAKNGLGLLLVIVIVVMLAMKLMEFPAAGSEQPEPQWVYDSEGHVYDTTGQYVRVSNEDFCKYFPWLCPEVEQPTAEEMADATNGGGSGCGG